MEHNGDNCLPQFFTQLNHQAAGHKYGENGSHSGILKHADGSILKGITDSRGEKELKFYETVFSTPRLAAIKSFMPRFRGSVLTQDSDKQMKFIRLEDVAEKCSCPCVLDVKIGKQTWDPLTASPNKILKEESKYRATKEAYGFSIAGLRYFCIKDNETIFRDKEFGKALTEDTTVEALQSFLNGGVGILVSEILRQLKPILEWFQHQSEFHFFASSVLIVYDAKGLSENNLINTLEETLHDKENLTNTLEETLPQDKENLADSLEDTFPQVKENLIDTLEDTLPQDKENLVDTLEDTLSQDKENLIDTLEDRLSQDKENLIDTLEHTLPHDKDNLPDSNNELNKLICDLKVRVVMIDFAHVNPATTTDNNFLFGLRNLISMLESLLH